MDIKTINRFRPQELADRLGCYVVKETLNMDDVYWWAYTVKPECFEEIYYIPRDESGNRIGEQHIINRELIKDTTRDKCHVWSPRKSGGNDENS